jgi:hypothetical protein
MKAETVFLITALASAVAFLFGAYYFLFALDTLSALLAIVIAYGLSLVSMTFLSEAYKNLKLRIRETDASNRPANQPTH